MATANGDRNLLFGILALQMDFIGRDALVLAMNAWVLDKAKPLGRILLEQGALTEDAHALLDALVRKHLELHGGDAEKSLAAVSSVRSVREELRGIADPDVQASMAHVPAGRPSAGDSYATAAPSVGRPDRRGPPLPHPSTIRRGRPGQGVRCQRRGTAPRGGAEGNSGAVRR